jgi:riboflavin biosynthesis pyrimidine reductase
MQQITVDRNLREIARLIDSRIEGDVIIEAGPALLMALVKEGAVDLLELSITPKEGDGDFVDLEELLSHFIIESEIEIDETRLLQCRDKSNASNG